MASDCLESQRDTPPSSSPEAVIVSETPRRRVIGAGWASRLRALAFPVETSTARMLLSVDPVNTRSPDKENRTARHGCS